VTPHRSAGADALRRNGLTVWPGMTIFWIGDLAHQGSVSGHNPDDYTGVRAEMLDDDMDPEVRALDFMISSKFTTQDGWNLVNALVEGVDKGRLYYVIYRSTIWRRATGFQPEGYGGDNHNDHVHVSTHVSGDDNGSDWQSVLAIGQEDVMTIEQLHALLLSILTADTPAERQVRDMIMGGPQSPVNGRGLLSNVMDNIDDIPPCQCNCDCGGDGGGVTIEEVRALLQEEVPAAVRIELDGTKLIGSA